MCSILAPVSFLLDDFLCAVTAKLLLLRRNLEAFVGLFVFFYNPKDSDYIMCGLFLNLDFFLPQWSVKFY